MDSSRYGKQLLRGDIIMNRQNHHRGMAYIKETQGDPRPSGSHLSLIVFDGPGVYWGYTERRQDGVGVPVLLSRSPDDYAWETPNQNAWRKKDVAYWKLERACAQ